MELFTNGVRTQWPEMPVRKERFATSTDGVAAQDAEVTAIRRGKPVVLEVRAGQRLIDAARQAGAPIQTGCEQGACGTCKVRVLSGQLETPEGTCLSPAERAAGLALACVGRPSARVVIDVD